MMNLIDLPESANSAESWRRQIAEVCERANINPHAHRTDREKDALLHLVCTIIRFNFPVTPDNIEAVKAGIRLYLGMHPEDPIDTRALMEGK